MFDYAHERRGARSARTRRRPRDARSLHAEVDGRPLDDDGLHLFFMLLVDAGGDTTRNLRRRRHARAVRAPGRSGAALRGRPRRRCCPTAIEEMLRWVSPVVYMRRTATADSRRCAACRSPRATRSSCTTAPPTATRARSPSPTASTSPAHPNEHVAFGGGGPHFCLGAHIARVEIDAMLREMLTRLPDIEPRRARVSGCRRRSSPARGRCRCGCRPMSSPRPDRVAGRVLVHMAEQLVHVDRTTTLSVQTFGDAAHPAVLLIGGAAQSMDLVGRRVLPAAGRPGPARDPLRPPRHRPLDVLSGRGARLHRCRPRRRPVARPGRARRRARPPGRRVDGRRHRAGAGRAAPGPGR